MKSSPWILLQNPTRWQKPLRQALVSSESVGALKTVILGLVLWQRALLEDVTGKIPQQQEVQRKEVEPLERRVVTLIARRRLADELRFMPLGNTAIRRRLSFIDVE